MENHWAKEATKPIIIAVICGLLTIFMLFLSIKAFMQWDNMQPLREGALVISDGRVLPENDGKLVLVSGRVTAEGCVVSDRNFDVTVESPYLVRSVEMRQWRNSRGQGNKNGLAEAVWWHTTIPSQEINGQWYRNPGSIPFEGNAFYADTPVMLGEFSLSRSLLEKLLGLPNRVTGVRGLEQSGADKNGLELVNDMYYLESDFGWGFAGIMDIGDVRVYFEMADPSKLGEITVMAKQENGMLTAYDNEDISPINVLYDGIMNKDEVVSAEKSTDNAGAVTAICMTAVLAIITAIFTRKILAIKRKQATR